MAVSQKLGLVFPPINQSFDRGRLGGGSSSVCRDLAWELEGGQFKSSMTRSIDHGLVIGEMPVFLLDTIP